MTDPTVPVLIVGGGGAGLTASMLLSTLGVESLLVSALPTTSVLPKAHVLNQRAMEILREAGVADAVYARSTPAAHMPQVEPAVAKSRAARLRQAVAIQRRSWLASLIGQRQRVLAEADGAGHAENFAPVRLPPGVRAGEMFEFTPQRLDGEMLA